MLGVYRNSGTPDNPAPDRQFFKNPVPAGFFREIRLVAGFFTTFFRTKTMYKVLKRPRKATSPHSLEEADCSSKIFPASENNHDHTTHKKVSAPHLRKIPKKHGFYL